MNAESITDDRLHIPSDIDEAYRNFPAVGRRIRIEYHCEYHGMIGTGKERIRKRTAIVIQKERHKEGAHFTVELVPEAKTGCRGKYRLTFMFSDLTTGQVKVWGVGK